MSGSRQYLGVTLAVLSFASVAAASDAKTISGVMCRTTDPTTIYPPTWVAGGAIYDGPGITLSCPLIKDTAGLPLEFVYIRVDALGPGSCMLMSSTSNGSSFDFEMEFFAGGRQTVAYQSDDLPTHYVNGRYGLTCAMPEHSYLFGIRYSEQT